MSMSGGDVVSPQLSPCVPSPQGAPCGGRSVNRSPCAAQGLLGGSPHSAAVEVRLGKRRRADISSSTGGIGGPGMTHRSPFPGLLGASPPGVAAVRNVASHGGVHAAPLLPSLLPPRRLDYSAMIPLAPLWAHVVLEALLLLEIAAMQALRRHRTQQSPARRPVESRCRFSQPLTLMTRQLRMMAKIEERQLGARRLRPPTRLWESVSGMGVAGSCMHCAMLWPLWVTTADQSATLWTGYFTSCCLPYERSPVSPWLLRSPRHCHPECADLIFSCVMSRVILVLTVLTGVTRVHGAMRSGGRRTDRTALSRPCVVHRSVVREGVVDPAVQEQLYHVTVTTGLTYTLLDTFCVALGLCSVHKPTSYKFMRTESDEAEGWNDKVVRQGLRYCELAIDTVMRRGEPVTLMVDGRYDSARGAQHCTVTAIEYYTRLVVGVHTLRPKTEGKASNAIEVPAVVRLL
ncbi:hypothetical protein CBR_g52264 [Chara braunii]|uniref:Uncharacterized protein n=1 Tax=Chara braunii TaxID=69332 RepID=A0A388M9X5_CHABU|nr:hypothetical protein CBR_g52264 [Chara braunii]|eukprot:GBG91377.1 hypothetical protein CBR_g52264 [Chara braunii]